MVRVRYVGTLFSQIIGADISPHPPRISAPLMVRVRYVSTVRFKNWTEVRYAGRYGLKYEVRSTQILNVPYSTAILAVALPPLQEIVMSRWNYEQNQIG